MYFSPFVPFSMHFSSAQNKRKFNKGNKNARFDAECKSVKKKVAKSSQKNIFSQKIA
jgi:hypothetical protein